MFSPRLSRDGRYVAALSEDAKKLMLDDLRTNRWSELAQGSFGWNNWSYDGKYVYVVNDRGAQGDEVLRVSTAGRKSETVLNLKNVPQTGDLWSQRVAPGTDNSPLLMRDKSTQEIYALDLQLP